MSRKQNDPEPARFTSLVLLLVGLISCGLVYSILSTVLRPTTNSSHSNFESLALVEESGSGDLVRDFQEKNGGCCRGIDNLELWGAAVKWGSDFKFNSSSGCCKACKGMCSGSDGPCLCDSWVFCGNKEACGSKFGECWLKKQKDTLAPERQEAGHTVLWTSGLIFGRGEGIVGMETEYGCQLYRAESRGQSWDSEGNHIKNAPLGPPFALIQGTLEAQGVTFKKIPTEVCPTISRGSVAWIGSGPEFFISLANHPEWKKSYTVFGSVLPEDMEIAEKIARLPTKSDVWNNINVSVLEKPVPLMVRRMKTSHEDLNTNVKSE